MLRKTGYEGRSQISMVSLDELVPIDHLVRKIEYAIDFSFIYDMVRDVYCEDNGRPSIDPVVLIKIALIQCLFGIRSMRQTIKEIETNVAYRWFIGYDFSQPIPHFSTLGKNYVRRFRDTSCLRESFIASSKKLPGMVSLNLTYSSSTRHMLKQARTKTNM